MLLQVIKSPLGCGAWGRGRPSFVSLILVLTTGGDLISAGGTQPAGDIRISNQFLITRALHFAQLRLRPLNYTLRPNVIVTLA